MLHLGVVCRGLDDWSVKFLSPGKAVMASYFLYVFGSLISPWITEMVNTHLALSERKTFKEMCECSSRGLCLILGGYQVVSEEQP